MLYSLAVSAVYAAVWAVWPEIANASLILFVALLLIPACWFESRRRRNGT